MTSAKGRRFRPREISRVCADRAVREQGSGMAAHHCHTFFELYYVEQGSCRFLINDSIHDLEQGDFILIPPQTFHYTRYLHDRCARCNLYFRAEDIGEHALGALPEGRDFFSYAHVFHAEESCQGQISALLTRMLSEERLGDACTAAMQLYCLQELFLFISRFCSFTQTLPESISTSDRQTLLAARFISGNYMHPITSADIAAAAGFSPNHLSKKFREAAGVGVHEYLVFTRLQHAAAELVSTTDTITQIALRCGFSDSNYFKDVFKKKYGMTPREYRKAH